MSDLHFDERKLAVDVLLAEFKELKAEIGVRAQRQTQAFNYFILIFAAIVGGLATVLSGRGTSGSMLQLFTLDAAGCRFILVAIAVLPCLTTPLAFFFFDDELMIFEAEIYILTRVTQRIKALIDPDVVRTMLRGQDLLSGTFAWRSRHLQVHFEANHSAIALGRYWLFRLPIEVALIGVLALGIREVVARPVSWGWIAAAGLSLVLLSVMRRALSKALGDALAVRDRYCELVQEKQLGENDFDGLPLPHPRTHLLYFDFWGRRRMSKVYLRPRLKSLLTQTSQNQGSE